ncbi:lysozyme inhibitor LprI family protein [Sphingomonas oligophenolica]|uniref:DUF1311 domain-containing protein n=1 Tax=Sphingomonas oligophenolica TaxID=301154 RepID=A0A502CKM1_9SPHN|nr:lysozyme inhibitor LprI family protein [Sphingomonas oligophenolica]TPG13120.1 DUF1311 domain-containing protein [Sphingomonas oligophenolica]
MPAVIFIMAIQAAIAGPPQDTTEGCNDKYGTAALSSCYSEHAESWKRRVIAAYPIALDHTKGRQRDALKRAQDAWLKYRAASCEFYELEQGSIHFIWGAYCMLDLTRRRALELEEYVQP